MLKSYFYCGYFQDWSLIIMGSYPIYLINVKELGILNEFAQKSTMKRL